MENSVKPDQLCLSPVCYEKKTLFFFIFSLSAALFALDRSHYVLCRQHEVAPSPAVLGFCHHRDFTLCVKT